MASCRLAGRLGQRGAQGAADAPVQLTFQNKIDMARLIDIRRIGEIGRQKNDGAAGNERIEPFCQLDAVHARHADIQHGHARGIALLRHGGQQGKRGLEAAGDRLRLTAPDGGLRLPRMQELVVTDRNGDHAAAPFRRRLAVHSPPDGVSA